MRDSRFFILFVLIFLQTFLEPPECVFFFPPPLNKKLQNLLISVVLISVMCEIRVPCPMTTDPAKCKHEGLDN